MAAPDNSLRSKGKEITTGEVRFVLGALWFTMLLAVIPIVTSMVNQSDENRVLAQVGLGIEALILMVGMLATVGGFCLTKRIPILLCLSQLLLFTVIPYHWERLDPGVDYHYDRTPGFLDFALFSAAHALRAADVLDVLEEYHLIRQPITHASPRASALTVAMHITTDILLLGLLARWARVVWRRWALGSGGARTTNQWVAWVAPAQARAQAAGAGLCAALYVWAAVAGGWAIQDWVLWPADTVLRVVDIGDVMHVFRLRLHGVEPSYHLSALAIGLRLVAGLYLIRRLEYWHLVLLRGMAFRTIDQLVVELESDSPRARAAAAMAIAQGETGPDTAAAALAHRLTDPDPAVRRAAVAALAKVTPGSGLIPATAIPHLRLFLRDKDSAIRSATVSALGRAGVATGVAAELLQALSDPDPSVQSAAVEATGHAEVVAAIPRLLDLLRTGGNVERAMVGRALAALDPGGERIVPTLIGLIQSADRGSDAREVAVAVVGRIGPPAAAAAPALIRLLLRDDDPVCIQAAEALGRIRPAAAAALETYNRATATGRPSARDVANAVGAVAPAIPALASLMRTCFPEVRVAAEGALVAFGAAAIPAVTLLASSRDDEVRKAAKEVLRRIASGG